MLVAGVDEAGRGALAGPVVAAAVILPDGYKNAKDSKQLSAKQREKIFQDIKHNAIAIGIAEVDHTTIDKINILQAALLAMKLAIDKLSIIPDKVLIDGNQAPKLKIPWETIIKGDSKVLSIAAASIIAKVTRDKIMSDFEEYYPGYGFAKHKGYPTKDHKVAIAKIGPSKIHRLTFNGVVTTV